MRRLTWGTVAVVGWPVLALVGWLGAGALPSDHIWAQALAATLWSAPPWMAVAWPVWTAVVARLLRCERPWMLVSLLGLLGTGLPVRCTPAARAVPGPDARRVAVLNVNAFSPERDPTALHTAVDALEADVVVLLERRVDDLPGWARVADDFGGAWPRASHHSAVYARPGTRVEARISPQVGSPTMAMPVALVWLPDVAVCLLGVHAPPQVPKDASGMGPHIDWLAEHLVEGRVEGLAPCPDGAPAVLAGDFNHVPGSGPLAQLRGRGLEDVLAWTALGSLTWPSGGGWPDLPVFRLDHVLAGPVRVSRLVRTRVPGSDHQGWAFSVEARD